MGFEQYHEPAGELSAETRTFARMIASLTEEAEAIGWYEQRIAIETDREAVAVMQNAQGEEFADAPANDAGREAVLDLRTRMIAMFREIGSVHIQIGKVYPYRDAMAGTVAWDVIETIKDAVDPNGILSPGKQGFWPASMRNGG